MVFNPYTCFASTTIEVHPVDCKGIPASLDVDEKSKQMIKREGERDRETDRQTETETDRPYRQIDRDRNIQRKRLTDRDRVRVINRQRGTVKHRTMQAGR